MITWHNGTAKLGRVRVGSVGRDIVRRSAGYTVSCVLPQMDRRHQNVATEEEAMAEVERLVQVWLDAAGLKVVEHKEGKAL